jgi:hypothetical protein
MAQVFIHSDLLSSMPRGGMHRRKILDFICDLQSHPEARGDYSDKDDTLRLRQIKIIGEYAVT